jgi:hypothetical protein
VGLFLNKNLNPSPALGFGLKPDLLIYLVRPNLKTDLSPTYIINFYKVAKTLAKITKPEPNLSPKKSGPTNLYFQTKVS